MTQTQGILVLLVMAALALVVMASQTGRAAFEPMLSGIALQAVAKNDIKDAFIALVAKAYKGVIQKTPSNPKPTCLTVYTEARRKIQSELNSNIKAKDVLSGVSEACMKLADDIEVALTQFCENKTSSGSLSQPKPAVDFLQGVIDAAQPPSKK